MKTKLLYLGIFCLSLFSQKLFGQYQLIATDAPTDGVYNYLPDATHFYFYHDRSTDSLHFSLTIANLNNTMASNLGCNIMVNIANASQSFNFWGNQNQGDYNYLLTAWLSGTAPSNYTGIIGVSDPSGINTSNYTNLHQNNLRIVVDTLNQEMRVSLKREDFIPSQFISSSNGLITVHFAAAVGSNQSWNDDIFDRNNLFMINPSSIGLEDPGIAQVFDFHPNPSTGKVEIEINQPTTLQVLNTAGQILKTFHLEKSRTLDLSDLPKGLYLVKNEYTTERLLLN